MVNMIFGMIACKQTGEPHQHSFGIWETTKVPTETESGQMQRECEVCGEIERFLCCETSLTLISQQK